MLKGTINTIRHCEVNNVKGVILSIEPRLTRRKQLSVFSGVRGFGVRVFVFSPYLSESLRQLVPVGKHGLFGKTGV